MIQLSDNVGDTSLEDKFSKIPAEIFSTAADSLELPKLQQLETDISNHIRTLESFKQILENDLENRTKLAELLSQLTEKQDEILALNANKLQVLLTFNWILIIKILIIIYTINQFSHEYLY